MNRRIPNGTYGGVRGRRLIASTYSIIKGIGHAIPLCLARIGPIFYKYLFANQLAVNPAAPIAANKRPFFCCL